MDWITKLATLIGAPLRPEKRDSSNWDMVALALSVPFPKDYQQFIEYWGHGKFADFIHFFHPHTDLKALVLPQAVQGFVYSYATMKSGHPDRFPMPIIPEKGGFLPFAITDNGDYFGWIISDKPTDEWPVAALLDEEGVAVDLEMSFPAFMISMAEGTIRKDIFPDSFFRKPPEFQRY